MYNIRYGFSYLLHRFKANNRHGIHSPFVYKLIDTVIYDYSLQKVYREIEKICETKYSDKRVINLLPLKVYKLLYRLAVYFKPATIFFDDKGEGILAACLKIAVPNGRFFSINDLQKSCHPDMVFTNAAEKHAAERLQQYLPYIHDDTVLVFSNIHRTKQTKQAWEQVKANERIKVTIDLFYFGLVFFKPGMSKEDFKVRY